MTVKNLKTLEQNLESLEKRHTWNTRGNLIFGVALIGFSFYAIGAKPVLPGFLNDVPYIVYGILGGPLVGVALGNRKGTKELKLLRSFKAYCEHLAKNI